MSDDDAPEAVSFSAASTQFKELVNTEKAQRKKAKQNRKRKRPKWKDSQPSNTPQKSKKPQADANLIEKEDDIPPSKRRRISTWLESSDMFYFDERDKGQTNDKSQNEHVTPLHTEENQQETHPDTDAKSGDMAKTAGDASTEKNVLELEDVPLEVLQEFLNALTSQKSNIRVKDEWMKMIRKQKNVNKKMWKLKKISQYDTVMIDGFEIELDHLYDHKKHYLQTLKRAIRFRTFVSTKQHRSNFNKQISMGYQGPAYAFSSDKGQKPQTDEARTVWGKHLPSFKKKRATHNVKYWLKDW